MKKINLGNQQPTSTSQPTSTQAQTGYQNQTTSSQDLSGANQAQSSNKQQKMSYLWIVLVLIMSISLGVITGFGASKLYGKNQAGGSGDVVAQVPENGQIKAGDIFGSKDENFKDEAEGYLEAGGIDGEGSHKLLRPGGPSQTVYLTSSVMDLDKFVGMNVKVYGETYQGQKAGWLMDVGRVEVINPQGEVPAETE